MLGDLGLHLRRGTRGRKGYNALYKPIIRGEELLKQPASAGTSPVPISPEAAAALPGLMLPWEHSPKSSQTAKRSHVM